MPELLLELFSEEIPARMQEVGAGKLAEAIVMLHAALGRHSFLLKRRFWGPRRIGFVADVAPASEPRQERERGPRLGAPEAALAGFFKKHGAVREAPIEENGYWVLVREIPGEPAAAVIARVLPPLLWRFAWPKSMRWGGESGFSWVRPLRRILCLLDGEVVPFALAQGDDDAHGLTSGNLTEGHRFLAPGAFAVHSVADWEAKLRKCFVIADPAKRRQTIEQGLAALATKRGLKVVPDEALLNEVTGLVEWPVPMIGRIDAQFMDLPAEVRQVSMRVHQRYFALCDEAGTPAPYFAFVANIKDGGAAIVAGNERVLRARLADAQYFWNLDRRVKLADRLPALDRVIFHDRLGSQGGRVRRLASLASHLAPLVGADAAKAERAALLAKADLTTGMVGEFPELQGVMGRYYALHDGEDAEVADAIRDHYAPRGAGDDVPTAPVSIAVALADKLDLLAGFFSIGAEPSGGGDPYALRRAALGAIRIVLENGLCLRLDEIKAAAKPFGIGAADPPVRRISDFIRDRLIVQLRGQGMRHDVLAAVFRGRADARITPNEVLPRAVASAQAVARFLEIPAGADLLVAYRRAANILRIEERKDGPHKGEPDPALMDGIAERGLAEALAATKETVMLAVDSADFTGAMQTLAGLRDPVDTFFDQVTVNAPGPELRRNRLKLLAKLRDTMNLVADFSRIEG